ncbi:glycosyltransferase family 4 protein [Baekduia soli]|uniref:Glycosyltransferase family 4 protein n=1 Tax=Baekduia soli TaxID=496014 RepID=A0A5B8U150_9ACTN|nr:glycosyltransferase [Baekduia soli]QEC46652.1 glycosyltransferase family 4 protein [Baekduia soli]
MPDEPAIAYIVGLYPGVSHSFILREVEGLRARGARVETFSLRRVPDDQLLTDADRRAARETSVILPPPPGELVGAHLRALRRRPGTYLRTLAGTLRSSAGGARNGAWKVFYFTEGILLWDRLQRRGIGHVHAHFANAASDVAMVAAQFGADDGVGWSFTMHGPTEFDDVTRYGLPRKVAEARFVACIGDYCRSQLMRISPPQDWAKLQIVRCGLDVERFTATERPDRPGGRLDVLCLGRLVPDKGQRTLVHAVAALRREGLDVRATLAGDGPDRPALTALVQELGLAGVVTLTGPVGQDDVGDLYQAADVFCLPSFAEGIPVVLMEAMAMELPVVTTQIMGIPELVDDGVHGLLVEPGRPDVLAAALRALAADPAARREMGRRGRARVAESFSAAEAAERIHALLGGPAASAPRM